MGSLCPCNWLHPALKKTVCGSCDRIQTGWYDQTRRFFRDLSSGDRHVYLGIMVRRVDCRVCGGVKREKIEFVLDDRFYTKRFGYVVGRRCREGTVQSVAEEYQLNWHTVKELDKNYMREQIVQAPEIAPQVIGIDEISVRKGHDYRIVVSDLERRRPIWYGGIDRSEESMNMFYKELGPAKCSNIRLAVMDMWKPFRKSTLNMAPGAAILYDKFHVLRHLGEALDQVRKSEYHRLKDSPRKFIKGQKYNLLSNKENLTGEGRKNLYLLLAENKRLNTAYLLKESFDQLWTYTSESWARKFFDNWKESLKWQRLPTYEKFAKLVERHWGGVAAYCRPENKVALGFVEGLNNKIRVIQRRAYGIRDEEYLRLKILTCMLPEI